MVPVLYGWGGVVRLQRGWDVSREQTGGRVWSMAGFLSSNCSSGATLGLISEVLKVGFYGVRPRASCVSRVIFKTRRLMAEIMEAAYV